MVALSAIALAAAPPLSADALRVGMFALAAALLWLARASGARWFDVAAALALVSVATWDAIVALRGGDGALPGGVALAALAVCSVLLPRLRPSVRSTLAAGSGAALAALALFALGPLRAGGDALAAALLFAATCALGAALGLAEGVATARTHAPREAPLVARFAIASLAALGALVLGGWLLGSRFVVQGGTSLVPTQFNSALSLFALGIALAAALRGSRAVLAVTVALVLVQASLSLLQEYGGLNLGIDQLVWRHAIVAENVPPGRMAPGTAMALLVGAVGVLGTWRAQRRPGWWPIVWGCGLIVAAVVVVALAGFALQVVRLRAWGEHTPIALPTVVGLAALAVALLALGIGHARARALPSVLVPAAFAVGAMLLSVYTWNELSRQQSEARRASAVVAAQSVSDALRNFLRTRLGMFGHMAERLALVPDEQLEAAFRGDARRILRDFPGLFSVAWIDTSGTTRAIESPEDLGHFVGSRFDSDAVRGQVLERARASGELVLSPPLELRAGGLGFFAMLPVRDGDTTRGFVSAAIRYEPLLDALLATTALGYRIELRDAGRQVYLRDANVGSRLEVTSAAELYSRQWLASLRPSRSATAAAERVPELVLFGGLLLGGLVAVALRFALLSRARATQAEAASAALRSEAAERERAQRELEDSRNELTAVLENSPDGFQMFDREWRFVYMNPKAEQIARRPRAELLGKVLWDEFPEALGDPTTELMRRAMERRQAESYESYYAPFGQWFGIVAFPHPIGLAMFIRDVTAQRDAYERVRRSESSLARAQRIAGIGSWELPLADGAPVEGSLQWSQQTYRIFGLEPGLVTATTQLFESHVHPEDLGLLRESIAEAVAARDPLSVDHRIVRPDGVVRYVHQEADFIFDARGAPIRLVGTVQDVTARKEAEEALRLALEGVQARNLELQDFAFVASHDLQEPLRKIQAFGERLAARESVDEQGRDYIERMRHAAARMQTLIDDLLAYSRVATRGQAFVHVDLEAIAREVLTDLESAIEGAGAEVRIGPLPGIHADPTQMRQLLQNLLSNSLKFRAPGRKPLVTVDAERFDRPGPDVSSRRERWCRLLVRDNGIGFDNRHRDRIMQPFQRLHGRGEYEGTGIGLAIVRRIVERHGGTIAADGVPGGGATFAIELPLERLSARSDGRTTLAMGGAGQE